METISDLLSYLVTPVVQVAMIMGLAELAKQTGLKKKYVPLLDLGLGLFTGYIIYTVYQNMHPIEGLLIGTALGLSACGLFSGIKNLTNN